MPCREAYWLWLALLITWHSRYLAVNLIQYINSRYTKARAWDWKWSSQFFNHNTEIFMFVLSHFSFGYFQEVFLAAYAIPLTYKHTTNRESRLSLSLVVLLKRCKRHEPPSHGSIYNDLRCSNTSSVFSQKLIYICSYGINYCFIAIRRSMNVKRSIVMGNNGHYWYHYVSYCFK